ncbi:MAG TPA: primosomal protein N' [Candidatus Corynebacterium gallistercoris]|uniref:Probable replication restart protein PriA n=1 Tax=Candidatus Corynebacterium gallistercoris TaxID=2838530 RepID=A0A9D1RXJ5_9CORY|nr:primosomal protein N' [Candidatus Corynebacterium gallistercoris]
MLGIAHLDRLFDYSVPAKWEGQAKAGVKVRVRFGGRLVDGIIIERRRRTDHPGDVKPIERVISPVVVMPERLWQLVNALADRYAGVRSDIVRSAIPSRHASAEKAGLFGGGKDWPDLYGALTPVEDVARDAWGGAQTALEPYVHGGAFLSAVAAGKAARASLLAAPGHDYEAIVAAVAAACAWNPAETGGGVLIIVPHQRHVDRLHAQLSAFVSSQQIVTLTASVGPSARYRRYMAIVQGQARIVIGTRSAATAPVHNLRLVCIVGESDDNLVDPRTPYMHARDVAIMHAEQHGAAVLIAGVHRSAEVHKLVSGGGFHDLLPARDVLRSRLPWLRGLGETDAQMEREIHNPGARIPSIGFEALRAAIDNNRPCLIHVPRRGYAPALACSSCRAPARCRRCNGPLELHEGHQAQPPQCRWCGTLAGNFRCSECGNRGLRMSVIGQDRTAEELGRAFPGVPVITSGGSRVVDEVPNKAGIVVATPGAEPRVQDGLYAACVIVDPWIPLHRQDLRAAETALRHWLEAAALVDSHAEGGRCIVAASAGLEIVQRLIRWDPVGAAARELAVRREASFPPAVAVAAIDGTRAGIEQLQEAWEMPPGTELLGPVDLPQGIRPPAGMDKAGPQEVPQRLIVRLADAHALGASLRQAQSVRSTAKTLHPLRVVIDPVRIG